MWIWVCGPYASEGADPAQRDRNLRALNVVALAVFRRGHTPIVGANMALPLIAEAGGDDAGYEIRSPLSRALLERCDACLRIGGPSKGADEEVERMMKAGKTIYRCLDELQPP